MFFEKPSFYSYERINTEATGLPNPIRKYLYRFKAKKRQYLVTVEQYSFGVHAIKYCGMKDRKAKNAYSIIYNDGDAIKVISTCLQIMLFLWREIPTVSFAFYAVPRKEMPKKGSKVRFNIYEDAMLNLFSPTDFEHYEDQKSCIYVMLNRKVKQRRSTIKKIGAYLLSEYSMIFEPESIKSKKPYMRLG